MKKNGIVVDGKNEALVMTKAFYKKACEFGSDEYYMLRKAQAENEGFEVAFQYQVSDKKTHKGLNFKRMAEYIKTQPNADERMMEFEVVKKIAKAKGAMYPLTKEWFFLTYPQYKEDKVADSEKAKAVEDEKAKAKAEAEAEKKIALLTNTKTENEDLATAVGF